MGLGAGALTLTPEGWAALGGRVVLLQPSQDGGVELAATTDALIVRTASAAVRGSGGNLAAAEAEVTRVRLGLKGTWPGIAAGGGAFVPSLEIGVRHDEGDAETGFGADIGAGLAWTHRQLGIEAEVRARGLLTHEDGGFRERGFAGFLAWDPTPDSDRGPSFRAHPDDGGLGHGRDGGAARARDDAGALCGERRRRGAAAGPPRSAAGLRDARVRPVLGRMPEG